MTLDAARIRTALFAANAAICASLGVWQLSTGGSLNASGLLSAVLPWFGLLFYGALAGLSFRRPESRFLSHAMGFYLFVHACLVAESVLMGRLCPACIAVAVVALLAGVLQCRRQPADRVAFAAALVLGIVAAFQHPLERMEDLATRKLWPAKILGQAPAFVDREALAHCAHNAAVRILVYEDEKSCRSCSGVTRRLLPPLEKDFPTQVCVHPYTLASVPSGQTLPLFVLLSKTMRLQVIEGLPDYAQLKSLLDGLIAESPAR